LFYEVNTALKEFVTRQLLGRLDGCSPPIDLGLLLTWLPHCRQR